MKFLDKIKGLFVKNDIVFYNSKQSIHEINKIYSQLRAPGPDSDFFISDPSAIENWVRERKKIEKPCHELILESGDPGPLPITKIGGEPWWPEGRDRPRCSEQGHPMVFMAQFLLSDIPGMEQRSNQLLSFHYCEQCSSDGNMSFGWDDKDHHGYEVNIFDNISDSRHDNKGIIAEPRLDSFHATFAQKREIPEADDWPDKLSKQWPHDYFQEEMKATFDENVYPGLIHVSRSKLGGWPSWVQNAVWPTCPEKQRMEFAGQIDWFLGENTSWAVGGYAYLFVCPSSCKIPKGELVILTT